MVEAKSDFTPFVELFPVKDSPRLQPENGTKNSIENKNK